MVIPPFYQVLVPIRGEVTYALTNGVLDATPAFERRDALLVSPALVTMITALLITSPNSHAHTLDSCVAVANFNVMTLQQATNTEPVPYGHMLLVNNHPKECEHFLSQLFDKRTENDEKQRDSIPETCNDASKLNEINKRISDEIFTLRGKEQLKPTKSDEQ